MKSCFNDDANWIKASEQALKSSAIKVAIRKKIKIVFWGENSALQLGDLKTKGRSGWDGNNNRYTNTLKGAEMKWILKMMKKGSEFGLGSAFFKNRPTIVCWDEVVFALPV